MEHCGGELVSRAIRREDFLRAIRRESSLRMDRETRGEHERSAHVATYGVHKVKSHVAEEVCNSKALTGDGQVR